MKQWIKRSICLLLGVALLSGCTPSSDNKDSSSAIQGEQSSDAILDQTRTEELYALSLSFVEHLSAGEIEEADAMVNEDMKKVLKGQLSDVWKELTDAYGGYLTTGDYIGVQDGDYAILEMTLEFEKASQIQRVVYDEQNLIAGLYYRSGAVTNPSDTDTVKEVALTVDAGEGYPLDGILSLPKSGEPSAVVVLLHGSGPSDKNQTIGANHPFQDIAQGLAEQGIAVLRYDKRTYTHGEKIASSADYPKFTIQEEVVNDAVAVVKSFSQDDLFKGKPVYLLGHSMSGGLLSYISEQGADCAGYIVMGGTWENIWKLSAEQNLLLAQEIEQGGDSAKAKEIRAFVETETARAEAIATMSEEELLSSTPIFGMPAWYLKKFDEIDPIALHLQDQKPVLFLQGEKDRQVTLKTLEEWKEGLMEHPDATYQTYPALNHLFGAYEGQEVPFSQLVTVEYAQSTPVAEEVITDITQWISAHAK